DFECQKPDRSQSRFDLSGQDGPSFVKIRGGTVLFERQPDTLISLQGLGSEPVGLSAPTVYVVRQTRVNMLDFFELGLDFPERVHDDREGCPKGMAQRLADQLDHEAG